MKILRTKRLFQCSETFSTANCQANLFFSFFSRIAIETCAQPTNQTKVSSGMKKKKLVTLRRSCIRGIPDNCDSKRCFSSFNVNRVSLFNGSSVQCPSPSNWSRWVWNFLRQTNKQTKKTNESISPPRRPTRQQSHHKEGRWVMVSNVIPASLAAWYIWLSTSMLTALVHSSSKTNWGLCKANR